MTPSEHTDPYDSLDYPCVSHNGSSDEMPITLDDAIEFLKMNNLIKVNLIRKTQQDTTTHLITILRAIISEQQKIGNLDRTIGFYILDAVFDYAIKKGWIE